MRTKGDREGPKAGKARWEGVSILKVRLHEPQL